MENSELPSLQENLTFALNEYIAKTSIDEVRLFLDEYLSENEEEMSLDDEEIEEIFFHPEIDSQDEEDSDTDFENFDGNFDEFDEYDEELEFNDPLADLEDDSPNEETTGSPKFGDEEDDGGIDKEFEL